MTTLLKKKKGIQISLELIDQQSDEFGNQITAIVGNIRELLSKKEDIFGSVVELEKLIFKRIGLKCNIVTNGPLAGIYTLIPNENHIFLPEYIRGNIDIETFKFKVEDRNKFLVQVANKKGYVNTNSAKLGGIFSQYTNTLYVNFSMCFNTIGVTDREMTAIILHEIGHGFSYCEYSDRFDSTNQILANLVLDVLNKKDKTDLVYVYKELSAINPNITSEDVKKLVSGDKVIAGKIWYTKVLLPVVSTMVNRVYDRVSSEKIADNFTSKFGYGRDLVVALDKIHKYYPDETTSLALYSLNIIRTMRNTLWSVFLITLSIYTKNAFWIFMACYYQGVKIGITVANMVFSGEAYRDYTYDDLKERYKSIRATIISNLKDLQLSKSEVKQLIDDIHEMDKVIKDTYNFKSISRILGNIVNPYSKKAVKDIEEQRLLEELANNDLFLKAAELKSL